MVWRTRLVGGKAEARALLRLALPIALFQVGTTALSMVDTAVAGHATENILASVGLGNSIFFALSLIGMGSAMGLDALIAQAVGAGDLPRAHFLFRQGVRFCLLASAVAAIPVLGAAAGLAYVGVEPTIARGASELLLARLPGLPLHVLAIAVMALFQAQGRTRPLVVAIVASNLVNLGATVLLTFGGSGTLFSGVPPMGALGIGLANSAAALVQFAVLLVAAGLGTLSSPADRTTHWSLLKTMARLGVPIGLQFGAEAGIFTLVGVLAARQGPLAIGAHQVALMLASFSFTFSVGISKAASVRVGLFVGARNTPAARISGITAMILAVLAMAIFGIAFFTIPSELASILTDDPDVIRGSTSLLFIASVFQLSDGLQCVGTGALRGAGSTRFPFAANLTGHYLVGLPVAVWAAEYLNLGLRGLWWGLCAGLTAVALALVFKFEHLSRRAIEPQAASTGGSNLLDADGNVG